MSNTKSPSAYVDQTPGQHGNLSHGLYTTDRRLIEGRPFDGHMLDLYHARLARWGYTVEELEAQGIQGDLVDQTAKLGTIVDLLWTAMLNAARLGQVERWQGLEKRYCHRVGQALTAMNKLIELIGETNTIAIDYQLLLEAQEARAKG